MRDNWDKGRAIQRAVKNAPTPSTINPEIMVKTNGKRPGRECSKRAIRMHSCPSNSKRPKVSGMRDPLSDRPKCRGGALNKEDPSGGGPIGASLIGADGGVLPVGENHSLGICGARNAGTTLLTNNL